MAYSPLEVLQKVISETVVDLRLRNAPTLDALSREGRVISADFQDLYWNVVVSDSATATVAMTTAGANQSVGQTVQATLGLGAYKIYHQFPLTRVEMKNAKARGTGALKKLFQFHVNSGILAIRKQINNYIWNADGTAGYGGFVGMTKVLDPTAVYANIDPATYTNWVPIVNTSGSARNLTKSLFYTLETAMEVNEVMYNSIVMNPTTAQKYRELFDTTAGAYQIHNVESRTNVDLATGGLYWNGIPILTDRFCPAGQVVFFDSGSLELMSFDLSDADQGVLAKYGLKDNFNGGIGVADLGGLQINVALLPQTNPGVLEFQMFVIPQLKVANRRMVQAILNLN
jgi:hypothetical protein